MALPVLPEHFARRDLRAGDLADVESALLLCYRWMHLSRVVDNRILELFRQGLMKGTVTGGQGNEGLIVPLALLMDKAIDCVSWTHRALAGHLIWSGHLVEHLNQYLANADSPTKAREGNVHHGDPANRSYPMISHLGSMPPNVVGATASQRWKGKPAIGVAFFGDGASSTGDIHEIMNLAAVFSVPVLFVVENNHYAYSTPVKEQFIVDRLSRRAAGYGMEGMTLEVSDTGQVLEQLAPLVERIRESGRPFLLEAVTYRLRGHAAYDTCDYLPEGQTAAWEALDPYPRLRARLLEAGKEAEIREVEEAAKSFLDESLEIALGRPRPAAVVGREDVFAKGILKADWDPAIPAAGGKPLTFAQALQQAHEKILRERPEALVLGQDIAAYGGPFKVTEHLHREFGGERVRNTPLCESATIGFATGLALNGHRPIVEFQFADFATDATTQILLNAGTYHYRSGAGVPFVLRFPCGGGLTFGSFHSQDLESIYLHAPGLKLLYPSTPQDAFDALLAAYEDDNPVLLFEHKGLYRKLKAPVAFNPDYRQVWHPRAVRSGDKATVVAWGEMVHLADGALQYLEDEYGWSLDLIDLRCLSPLDLEPVLASVRRTHRLAVVHEARRTAGFGAEICVRVSEACFYELEAPPLRIASEDTPVPFAPELEAVYRPSRDSVLERLLAWLEGGE
ncbi:MAG: transketolase [Puniceicoccaceae bacterium]|nr:MAG: transketolase [Puniceicoccaceae bacterium]